MNDLSDNLMTIQNDMYSIGNATNDLYKYFLHRDAPIAYNSNTSSNILTELRNEINTINITLLAIQNRLNQPWAVRVDPNFPSRATGSEVIPGTGGVFQAIPGSLVDLNNGLKPVVPNFNNQLN